MLAAMATADFTAALSSLPDGVAVRVKVVPGASRSRCMGLLGDRLKLAVAAPPHGGQANQAVCQLLADLLDIAPRQVVITQGHGQPIKTVHVLGLSLCDATERLGRVKK
jgi:uncharacterized protein (TIGR00251 family)